MRKSTVNRELRTTPISPPSGPTWAGVAQRRLHHWLFQGPHRQSKFLAATIAGAGATKRFWMLNRLSGRTGATRTITTGSHNANRHRAGSQRRSANCRHTTAPARIDACKPAASSHWKKDSSVFMEVIFRVIGRGAVSTHARHRARVAHVARSGRGAVSTRLERRAA